ncbi:MAG: hypothetical protein ACKVS9_00890 [Phycisphaerae bacterium]
MKRKPRTLPEIRREGFRALVDHLGAADAQRFMQQYDVGRGDYTKERHAWLDKLTLEEILASIDKRRTEQ